MADTSFSRNVHTGEISIESEHTEEAEGRQVTVYHVDLEGKRVVVTLPRAFIYTLALKAAQSKKGYAHQDVAGGSVLTYELGSAAQAMAVRS